MVLVVDEGSLELLEGLPINTSSQPTIKLLYPISPKIEGEGIGSATSKDVASTSRHIQFVLILRLPRKRDPMSARRMQEE
jgi:hypothetical protein